MTPEQRVRQHLDAGLAAHRRGDLAAARAAYAAALALAPAHPDALNLMGTALGQAGDAAAAIGYLERAARALPRDAGVISNLAQAYFAAGRYADAERAFRRAGEAAPGAVEPRLGLAAALALTGRSAEAHTLLQALAARHPAHPLVWFNLGNAQRDGGDSAAALESFRRAVALAPDFVEARNNVASLLHAQQQFADAEREYRECVRLAPDYVPAQYNLASVLIDRARFAEAEAVCRTVLARHPDVPMAHAFLGAALGHQGRWPEALACHRAALHLAPEDPKVIQNYAGTLTEVRRYPEALRWIQIAIALQPGDTSGRQMLITTLLPLGRMGEAWEAWGLRPAAVRFRAKYPDVPATRTLPADRAGLHVYVTREQGLGDELFFLRYAPQLAAAGARITYRGTNKIAPLFRRLPCLDALEDEAATLPRSGIVMLAGDLPYALTVLPSSPLPCVDALARAPVPDYPWGCAVWWPPLPPALPIAPLAEKLEDVRRQLAAAGPPPYVGITWRAGTAYEQQTGAAWDLYKEVPIAGLAAALRDAPGTFLALQRKPAPGELEKVTQALGRPVHDFTALNEDLEGMLALLAVIDDYVGVSNTNMHLRASAGRTARVLVPYPAEWRWMARGRESPWFPGFRVYRQTLTGRWERALAELRADLAAAGAAAGR